MMLVTLLECNWRFFTVDEKVGEIVNAICRAAKTGEVGDGKVVVTPNRTHRSDSHE